MCFGPSQRPLPFTVQGSALTIECDQSQGNLLVIDTGPSTAVDILNTVGIVPLSRLPSLNGSNTTPHMPGNYILLELRMSKGANGCSLINARVYRMRGVFICITLAGYY